MEVVKMKKLIMAMICIAVLTGCTNGDETTNNDTNNTSENTNDTINNVDDTTTSWFGNFEDALQANEITYSSKTSLDASSIGGIEGYRYVTESGNIDIYRYEDGDDFDKIVQNQKISLNGTDYDVELNDHYVIVSDGLSDDILQIFRNL